jgi:hypothetical protein
MEGEDDMDVWRKVAVLLVMATLAVACARSGGTEAAVDEQTSEGGEAQGVTGRSIVRYVHAPDPVFSYLQDTGELARWEEKHNLRLIATESWSDFETFQGGHGDVASVASYELPLLEQEGDFKVVAFGKYIHERQPLFRKAGDRFETLADVPEGAPTCATSGVSSTVMWSVIANELHDVDYRLGEGRFDMILQDHFNAPEPVEPEVEDAMPEMVASGRCTVAATLPEAAAPQLRAGELETLYGGRAPWQIYQQDICNCDHKGVMSNMFVAREEWYEAHPDQAAAFLELWERGLQLWRENREEIVSLYPDAHFSIPEQEDADYMLDYINDNDWFADTVYLDEAWIKEEKKLYDYLIDAGWMEGDATIPRFQAIAPPSS